MNMLNTQQVRRELRPRLETLTSLEDLITCSISILPDIPTSKYFSNLFGNDKFSIDNKCNL